MIFDGGASRHTGQTMDSPQYLPALTMSKLLRHPCGKLGDRKPTAKAVRLDDAFDFTVDVCDMWIWRFLAAPTVRLLEIAQR
jgi:hypothetical protein